MSDDKNSINRSRRKCCVYGCTSTQRKNHNLKFYSFPGRKWEVDRKLKWTEFVQRSLPMSGKSWLPSKSARICSYHFHGGEKSNCMNSVSYVPTIFGNTKDNNATIPVDLEFSTIKVEDYTESSLLNMKDPLQITTADRVIDDNFHSSDVLQNCIFFQEIHDDVAGKIEIDSKNMLYPNMPFVSPSRPIPVNIHKKYKSIGVQTDASINIPTSDMEILFCVSKDNNVLTQTNIIVKNPFIHKDKKIIVIDKNVKTEEKRCGTDSEHYPGFVGIADIEDNHVMKQFTGISKKFYDILVKQIELRKNGQPAYYRKIFKENRLLLFLMKCKLGLSFTALGCMFHIHATSASKVFSEILKSLSAETKTWITQETTKEIESDKSFVIKKIDEYVIPVKAKIVMFSNHKGIVQKQFAVAFRYTGKIIRVWDISRIVSSKPVITYFFGDNISHKHGDLFLVDYTNFYVKTNIFKTYDTVIDCLKDSNPELLENANVEELKDVECSFAKLRSFKILNHIPAEFVTTLLDIMHMCCIFTNSTYL